MHDRSFHNTFIWVVGLISTVVLSGSCSGKAYGDDIADHLAVAKSSIDEGNYEKAEEELAAASQQCKKSPQCSFSVFELRALAEERSGNLYSATSLYTQFIVIALELCLLYHSLPDDVEGQNVDEIRSGASVGCTVYARNLANMGRVLAKLGIIDEARSLLETALQSAMHEGIRNELPAIHHSFGIVLLEAGRLDEGLRHLEGARDGFRAAKNRQAEAASLTEMGTAYSRLNKNDQAISNLNQALDIARDVKDHYQIALTNYDRASVYLAERKSDSAENAINKAVVANRDGRLLRRPRWEQAQLYLETGRLEDLWRHLQSIPPRWLLFPADRARYHALKGAALHAKGDAKKATEELLISIALIERAREHVGERSRSSFFQGGSDDRAFPYRKMVQIAFERVKRGEEIDPALSAYGRNYISAAWSVFEKMKARSLAEIIQQSTSKAHSDIGPASNAFITLLSDPAEGEIYALLYGANKGHGDVRDQIEKIDQQMARLGAQEMRAWPIQADQMPLAHREVVLDYFISVDTCYLFIIRKGGEIKLIDLQVHPRYLKTAVDNLLDPMRNSKEKEKCQSGACGLGAYGKFSYKEAKNLFHVLLSEAMKNIALGENLTIIPDGFLALLPFEMLIIDDQVSTAKERFFGEEYDIAYYASAAVLASNRTRPRATHSKSFFGVAHPVYNANDPRPANEPDVQYVGPEPEPGGLWIECPYGLPIQHEQAPGDDERTLRICPVPQTERSVRELATLFKDRLQYADVLTRARASETGLRAAKLSDYKFIHFATHAVTAGTVPGLREPALVLAQVGNTEPDDGFLTLSEVIDLKIAADIVVLAACSTGTGEPMDGEGIMNFARAFFLAGAHSVLVSLWEVSILETEDIMKVFYAGLLNNNLPAGEALKIARRELIIREKSKNPFYWAAFVLYGG